MSEPPYYPNIPFVAPVHPLPLPTGWPADVEQITVRYGVEYYAYLSGLLKQLTLPDNWQGTPPQQVQATHYIAELLDQLITPVLPDGCDDGCIAYPPNSAIISYYPGDPYRNPDYVPPAWGNPPWYLIDGHPQTDLIWMGWGAIPLLQLIDIIFNSGFPRFQFTVDGDGEVEVHLNKVIQGGYAAISVDGQLRVLEDLEYVNIADLVSIGDLLELIFGVASGTLDTENIWEWSFAGDPGQHTIQVVMIPKLSEGLVLGFGGGLLGVTLCGFAEVPMDIQFRFTETCGMEYTTDDGATWTPVSGWDTWAASCFTGPEGPAGPQGPQGEPGEPGEPGQGGNIGIPDIDSYTDVDEICNAANGLADRIIAVVLQVIEDLQTITWDEILFGMLIFGGWDGALLVQLIQFLETSEVFWATIEADLAAQRDTLICELYKNELDKAAASEWAANFLGWTSQTAWSVTKTIDAIDNSKWALWAFVDSNKPATSPCDTCVGPWHAYFNFAEGQHTWFPGLQQGVYTAAYQPGNGWTATNWIEPVGDDPNTRALIYMAFTGAANLTGVNVVLGGLALDGGLQSSSWVVVFGGRYGSPLATVASAHGAGDYPGTFNQSYPGEQGIAIDVRCSDDQYGGATLISGLHLYGVDLPPQEIVENATLFEYL